MADYKQMYLTLFHATEQAIEQLIAAQRECGELYLSQADPILTILPPHQQDEKPEES